MPYSKFTYFRLHNHNPLLGKRSTTKNKTRHALTAMVYSPLPARGRNGPLMGQGSKAKRPGSFPIYFRLREPCVNRIALMLLETIYLKLAWDIFLQI